MMGNTGKSHVPIIHDMMMRNTIKSRARIIYDGKYNQILLSYKLEIQSNLVLL